MSSSPLILYELMIVKLNSDNTVGNYLGKNEQRDISRNLHKGLFNYPRVKDIY